MTLFTDVKDVGAFPAREPSRLFTAETQTELAANAVVMTAAASDNLNMFTAQDGRDITSIQMPSELTRIGGGGIIATSCIFGKNAATLIDLDASVGMILEPVHVSVLGCNRENAS